MKRVLLSTVLLVLLGACAMAISVNPGIIYSTPSGAKTNNLTIVGIPFQVHTPFYFEDLGVYAHNNSPLPTSVTVTVSLYSFTLDTTAGDFGLSSAAPVPNSTVVLTSSAPVSYGSVWGEVNSGNGLVLTPGWYFLHAVATQPGVFVDNPNVTFNSFSGAISYGLYHNSQWWLYRGGTFPNWGSSTSGPLFIAGGSLSVPEPSTYALMASVGLALYLLRRRREQAAKN